jgi:hypothetical protein
MQKERVPVADVAEQKGEGDKASTRMNYCGSEVAAGGCSGRPWRAHGRTAREGKEVRGREGMTRGKKRSRRCTAVACTAAAGVKASRPLIRVLVINDNGLWINNFFEIMSIG